MLNITLAGKNPERELKAKQQLEKLLSKYNIEKYFFTEDVVIEYFAKPHSHPVLTLNTKQLNDDDGFLAQFLHEQIHWYLELKNEQADLAISELKNLFPKVPVGGEDEAKDEHSTYLHLIVNFLEFEELSKLIGIERAKKVIENAFGYKWIYKKVLNEYNQIKNILEKHQLLL
jgi:hypothetical protein